MTIQITPTDTTNLRFELIKNSEVTQRAFDVVSNVNGLQETHLVLVHIDKKQNDVDGDGTPDTLDGKFCLSLINNDGSPNLSSGKEIKISQVHSVDVEKISNGSIDIVDWITDISNELIPIVVNKKATLAVWNNI